MRSPWLFGMPTDLLLVLGLPLLVLPVVAISDAAWSRDQIWLGVAAAAALGHHLPGLMRAYGDRDLYARFRTRFIVAPLVIGAAAVVSVVWDLAGVVFVFSLWGIWHFAMQTHGFARIYDGRVGQHSRGTALLDRLLCLGWFGAVALSSDSMLVHHFQLWHRGGGGAVSFETVDLVRRVWLGGTVVVTAVFGANFVRSRFGETPQSPVKLVLLATSLGFYGYIQVSVPDLLVGFALYEIFHDAQYLAIVWLFNRRRVEQGASAGAATRRIFQPGVAHVVVYVGLVMAYGVISVVQRSLAPGAVEQALKAFVIASSLLHYYYDGFIWKVREASVRAPLGLAGEGRAEAPRVGLPGWGRHALYACLVAAPALWLWRAQPSAGPPAEQARMVAAAVPTSVVAQYNLGRELARAGQAAGAVDRYRRVLALDPTHAEAHNNLGYLLRQRGELAEAVPHFESALKSRPGYTLARVNLAATYVERGDERARGGRLGSAILFYGRALETVRSFEPARVALVRAALEKARGERGGGAHEEAIQTYRRLLEVAPAHVEGHNELGVLLAQGGRPEIGLPHLLQAAGSDPQNPHIHYNIGLTLRALGRGPEARERFRHTLALDPDHPGARAQVGPQR